MDGCLHKGKVAFSKGNVKDYQIEKCGVNAQEKMELMI